MSASGGQSTGDSVATLPVIPLEKIIPSLLSSRPSDEDVKEFVYLCRNLAHAYLKTKVSRGKLDPAQFGIPLEDLALDCIAPLFGRNDRGRFNELANYFGDQAHAKASREDLLGATRRLVFSKVSEELFRMYREHDPSLSNIIRNIKIALRFSREMIPVVQNNEQWIQPLHAVHAQEGLPLMPPELIEARLTAYLDRRYDLPHVLHCIADVLGHQDLYQKRYPLIGGAIVIRSLMVRSLTFADSTVVHPDAEISPEEVGQFIRASIQKTRTAMRSSYVARGKMSEKTFDIYFDCVKEILDAEYIPNDGSEVSYFDVLQKRLTRLDATEYRTQHRVYLEYLVRLTRLSLLESLKSELQST